MGIIASKPGKPLKVAGIGILLMMSIISTIQTDSNHRKRMNAITCDGDELETLMVADDRQRARLFLDILKKLAILPSRVGQAFVAFCEVNSVQTKSLLVNAYQRNVFYVFAFSTVP